MVFVSLKNRLIFSCLCCKAFWVRAKVLGEISSTVITKNSKLIAAFPLKSALPITPRVNYGDR